MKKYLVIGNPIEHSLSPQLHNYWFEKHNINSVYDKKSDNHYNNISAFIKSIRGSDPNAAIYYLARMLKNG